MTTTQVNIIQIHPQLSQPLHGTAAVMNQDVHQVWVVLVVT